MPLSGRRVQAAPGAGQMVSGAVQLVLARVQLVPGRVRWVFGAVRLVAARVQLVPGAVQLGLELAAILLFRIIYRW
ncbi:hypothetical protein GCM10010402_27520 [Actinomadura luteofluorescens]